MLKIAVGNEKGGIGKTTTVYHLAATAAENGERVVMDFDADPQGSLSTQLGIPNNPALYNLLVRGEEFIKHIYSVPTERYSSRELVTGLVAPSLATRRPGSSPKRISIRASSLTIYSRSLKKQALPRRSSIQDLRRPNGTMLSIWQWRLLSFRLTVNHWAWRGCTIRWHTSRRRR